MPLPHNELHFYAPLGWRPSVVPAAPLQLRLNEFALNDASEAIGRDGAVPCLLGGRFVAPAGLLPAAENPALATLCDPNDGLPRQYTHLDDAAVRRDGAPPATRHVRPASEAQIDATLARAAADAAWATEFSLVQRHDALHRAAEALEDAAKSGVFAWTDAVETGVPCGITHDIAMGFSPVALAFMRRALHFLAGEAATTIQGAHGTITVRRLPTSPVVIIAPWNVPVGTIIPKLFVALLCGCNVVVKPSEFAPTSMVAALALIVASARLPPATLQVLLGGAAVGSRLTNDPRVRAVQFTGSPATASLVAAACSPRLCPLLAECGGSNAAIVGPFADLALAADRLAFGLTMLNGQWCMGVSRILCHVDVADEFLQLLVARLNEDVRLVCSLETAEELDAELPRGAPRPSLLVGPLAFALHAQSFTEKLASVGGTPIFYGGRSARAAHALAGGLGSFVQPTIVVDGSHEHAAACELFGPAATFHRFDSWEDALTMANAASGQLASYLFVGRDPDRHRLVTSVFSRLLTGMVMLDSINFAFEPAHHDDDPGTTFLGTAGVGVDGNGEVLAQFFTGRQCIGVNGPQVCAAATVVSASMESALPS